MQYSRVNVMHSIRVSRLSYLAHSALSLAGVEPVPMSMLLLRDLILLSTCVSSIQREGLEPSSRTNRALQ